MKIDFCNLLLCGTLLICLPACDLQGHGGVSNNIKESKKRNIFLAEYEVAPNPFVINDTLKIKVLNAWVENQWAYGKLERETLVIDGKYQLVIEVEHGSLEYYGMNWRIGINGDRYIRSCGSNCLIADFDHLPQEIEEWQVQNGWKLDSSSKKTIIGNFKIQRKK